MNTLFIFTGQPGTGKSTWSETFARHCRGCFIDIDAHYAAVVQAGLNFAGHDPNDRDSATFKQVFRDPIYSAMFALARDNLSHTHVVMNGPFTRELAQPDWHEQLASTFNVAVKIIYLTCDQQKLKTRIQQRALRRDRLKLENWDAYQRHFTDSMAPACKHTWVDTGKTDRDEWVTGYWEKVGEDRKNGG